MSCKGGNHIIGCGDGHVTLYSYCGGRNHPGRLFNYCPDCGEKIVGLEDLAYEFENKHMEVIRHSAIKSDDWVRIGKTSHEIMPICEYALCGDACTKGFLTSNGRFVERDEAMDIAIMTGQIPVKGIELVSDRLFSENLWRTNGFMYSKTRGYYK